MYSSTTFPGINPVKSIRSLKSFLSTGIPVKDDDKYFLGAIGFIRSKSGCIISLAFASRTLDIDPAWENTLPTSLKASWALDWRGIRFVRALPIVDVGSNCISTASSKDCPDLTLDNSSIKDIGFNKNPAAPPSNIPFMEL